MKSKLAILLAAFSMFFATSFTATAQEDEGEEVSMEEVADDAADSAEKATKGKKDAKGKKGAKGKKDAKGKKGSKGKKAEAEAETEDSE